MSKARNAQKVKLWPTEKARAVLDATMLEAELQAAVVEAAGFYGWLVYHTRDSRGSAAGFPDLVLARDGELIFAELKSTKGKLTHDQRGWLAVLGTVAEVAVWQPGELDVALERLRRRPGD